MLLSKTMVGKIVSLIGFTLLVAVHAQQEPCGYDALPSLPFLSRILNAGVAPKCRWPWVVAIRENRPGSKLCAGVLVGRDKVVTTASCVRGLSSFSSPRLFKVVLGEHNIYEDNEHLYSFHKDHVVQVRSIAIHPQFSGKHNDIAVIRLSENARYDSCILPACLPNQRRPGDCAQEVVHKCGYAAWGVYTDTSFNRSAELRTGWGRYFDQETCSSIYGFGRNNVNPTNTVCLEPWNSNQRPCEGDEGGMIVCAEKGRWILESLINVPSCMDTFPTLGVDLRAPTILSFIMAN